MDANKRVRIVGELPGLVTLYEDGSVVRHESNDDSLSSSVACNPEPTAGRVASTDVIINQTTGLWVRIFLPELPLQSPKIPVVLYFHGGGFCVGSPAWRMFDGHCSRMAAATAALWVSVGYRLAPEHRLPTGYEDSLAALAWLGAVAKGASEPEPSWLSTYGDFGQCFLAGDSVGGNIAHLVAVSAARSENRTLRIVGLMLMHPGFVKEGENMPERPPERALVTAEAVRAGAALALPPGSNMDYFVMNPITAVPNSADVRLPPTLVVAGKMDLFYEREVEYGQAMEAAGQEVEVVEYPEMGHCFKAYPQFQKSAEAADMLRRITDFMTKCRRGDGA